MKSIRLQILLVIALLALGFVSAAAGAAKSHQPGSLDKSFSENGRASVNLVPRGRCGSGAHGRPAGRERRRPITCNDVAYSVAIDTQGRIVIAGRVAGGPMTGVVRYLPSGTLDTSFSGDGIARVRGTGFRVATDSQDRIVIGPGNRRSLVRLSSDGSFDDSFADHGRLDASASASAFAIDSSDRIVVGSYRDYAVGPSGGIVLNRYLPDGSPDPSFDDSAIVELSDYHITDAPDAIAIDSDGGIVVAGYVVNFDDPQSRGEPGLAKFLPNGGLDTSFGGGDGTVLRGPFAFGGYSSLAIDGRGRIVAGGIGLLDRYLPDGSPDDSFAGDGRLQAGASTVVVDDENRLIAAAGSVHRFRPSGNIDPSFGNNGVAKNSEVTAEGLALDPRGRIVSSGYVTSRFTRHRSTDFAVARHFGG